MKQTKLFSALAILVSIATIVSLQSCTKLAKSLQYNLTLQSGSITVVIPPISNTVSGQALGSGTNNINVDSFVKANTAGLLGVSNIMSVKLTSCNMTVQNPTNANNLANFQSCLAYCSSNTENAPFQVNIDDNPDAFSNTISFPADTTTELKNYFIGNTFNYTIGGQLRRSTTDSLTCTIQFTFNVRVQG